MCGYFFLDDYASHYRLFSRFLFFLGIFAFAGGLRDIWRHPVFLAIVAYMVYLLLSGFWSEPFEWFRLGQKFVISVYLLNFIAITHYLVRWNRSLFEHLLQFCIVAATVAAAVSILVFYSDNPFPTKRLSGIGSLTNINEFSVVYGAFALLAMGFALRPGRLPLQLFNFLAVAVFISFAVLGQSRTTLAALLFALFALAGLTLREQRALIATILVILVAAPILIFPDAVVQSMQRGIGLRPQIWSGVWEGIKSAPVLGHGILAELAIDAGRHTFHNAHSAYLQVFWEGGVIGLALFLLLLFMALRYSYTLGWRQGDYTVVCMLLFAACVMTTDLDSLIARPRDQWILFWFPLALLLSYQAIKPGPAPHNTARSPG